MVAMVVMEGGDGAETNLEDCCVGEVYDQNWHGLPIILTLAYVDYEEVKGRVCSGDDDDDGDIRGLFDLLRDTLASYGVCMQPVGRSHFCPG